VSRTLFRGGMVFDGTGASLAPADVVTEDGRVVEVGPGLDGDEVVECEGKALLPGLFDMHVHLAEEHAEDSLFLHLANGVTTVQSMHGSPWHLALRERGIEAQIVIQRSEVDFDAPVTGDLLATSSLPPAPAWERFLATLERHGRARLRVRGTLGSGGGLAGEHEGVYVAVRA